MPMIQLDKETNELVTYYTEAEVVKLVDEILAEAEDWCGESLQVATSRVLFDNNITYGVKEAVQDES